MHEKHGKRGVFKTKAAIATVIMGITLASVCGSNNATYGSNSTDKYVQVLSSTTQHVNVVVKSSVSSKISTVAPQLKVVYKVQYGVATGDQISIRTGPGFKYSWQGGFRIGTSLKILGSCNNFYKVSYSGKTGFVSKQYVRIVSKPVVVKPVVVKPVVVKPVIVKSPTVVYKTQYGVATGDQISIRTGPGFKYSWQGGFRIGTSLKILGSCNNFYKVSYAGKTGFVSNQFVRITTKPVIVTPPVVVTPPVSTVIVPLYGNHTYGCNTIAEYNAVMTKVKEAVANGVDLSVYTKAYMAGDRASNYAVGSDMNMGLTDVLKANGYFISKVGNENATKIIKAGGIFSNLKQGASDPGTGAPSSAYDVLFNKVDDCDANAQLMSAIWDTMGFSSMVLGTASHADGIYKINGQWWVGFEPSSAVGDHITDPTY